MIKAAVLGSDVSRSRSPDIHHAAFKALGIEGRYEAISVTAADFRKTVLGLARAGYRYVNVTIPHKGLAARLADGQSPAVKMTGAANTLVFRAGRGSKKTRIFADNTDGAGMLDALADAGVRVGRRSHVVMVGAGGAAAGALLALARAGAYVRLLARRPAAAQGLRRRLPVALRTRVRVATLSAATLGEALAEADVLVSAVPAAAWEPEDARAGLRTLRREAAVLEMAYGSVTPLARAVRGKASSYQDGLPMLVHQAAHAIKRAIGKKPAAEPLFRAVERRRGWPMK